MLYNKGQAVVCKGTGVCEIVDVKNEKFGGALQKYYLLLPVYENCPTKIYIPVSNEATRLRSVISKDEIFSVLEKVKVRGDVWIEDEKEREKEFHSILSSNDYEAIIKMICEIHQKQSDKKKNGGKLRQSDENIMKEAEKTVGQEFAFALDISVEEVNRFIVKTLAK